MPNGHLASAVLLACTRNAWQLAGALAAVLTGLLIQAHGWRTAFVAPGVVSIACGLLFWRAAPAEMAPSARRCASAAVALPPALVVRAFVVMTAAAVSSTLLFNFSTNGNARLLAERLLGTIDDPARLGSMICIFGAIPFTDALIVRYVDDRMRSRATGMRLAVSFCISSIAVWLLGPVVKAGGFSTLLVIMAGISACTAAIAAWLPEEQRAMQAAPDLAQAGKPGRC